MTASKSESFLPLEPTDESSPSATDDVPLRTVGPDFDFTDPNSRFAPYYFQASHVVATILVVAIFLFFNLMVPLWHSDIWGHLKVGEWIVTNGRLPDRELFSPFSDPQFQAVNYQWLAQVLMVKTYQAGAWLAGGDAIRQTEGGVDLLRALHAFLEALKAAFLLAAFRRFSGSLPLAIAGVVLVFAFSLAPSAIQRPQVFAEVFFAVMLWLLAYPVGQLGQPKPRDEQLDSPESSPLPLSWPATLAVIALLVLWANMHGSFMLGMALVGVMWFGRVLESVLSRGLAVTIRDVPLHRPLFALIAGTILLSLLNPHGVTVIPEILAFAKNLNVLTMQEWKPLDFSTGAGGHWGYLILLVLIALSQIVSSRVLGPTQILLILLFGIGPLLQERLMTWWTMLVPVMLLPLWFDIGQPFATTWQARESQLSLRKTIVAGSVLLIGLVWSSLAQLLLGHEPLPITRSVSQATLWSITPNLLVGQPDDATTTKHLEQSPLYKALRDGLKTYPGGRFRGRIFTAEALGDYLVWSLPPKAPVLVYSHVHVFPPDFWEDYMEALFARPGWRFVLDKTKTNLVIVQVDQRQDLIDKLKADADWDVILDETNMPITRSYRLFAALRKKPLGE